MKAYSFSQIMSMSDEQRAALHQEEKPSEPLSAEKIAKIASYTGLPITNVACTVMKHDPASYAAYRAQSYRRVNS